MHRYDESPRHCQAFLSRQFNASTKPNTVYLLKEELRPVINRAIFFVTINTDI